MIFGNYTLIDPKIPLPACLVTFVPNSKMPQIHEIEQKQKRIIYRVRATVSSNIPLTGNIENILTQGSNSLLLINENPLTIYLHHYGNVAVFYDLESFENENLSNIFIEIEGDHPNIILPIARTLINQLLDTIMRELWLPLSIIRLDILDKDNSPLVQQIHLPFLVQLKLGPLGGYSSFPLFAAYESIVREAISSTSPYYRFLCAYRLTEGISKLRFEIRKLNDRFGVTTKLPKPPEISNEFIGSFGFHSDFVSKIKNFDTLIKEMKMFRNAIAHFFIEEFEGEPLDISIGEYYRLYSAASAVLLHYAHQAFSDLRLFFHQNLDGQVFRGSPCIEAENRELYIVKANSFFEQN